MDQPADNFLLLRFIAASLVVVSHSYDTLGVPGGDFLVRMLGAYPVNLGITAVIMFFVVSGFMVTASYARRHNLFDFLRSRILRIVPAYAVCVSLTALAIGALCTLLPLADYFKDPTTRGYVFVNLLFNTMQWNLPGVFTTNPHPDNVNASLWTLPIEVRMYLYVAAFGVLGLLRRRWVANIALVAIIACGFLVPTLVPLFQGEGVLRDLHLPGLFALGALCYVNRDYVPVSGFILSVLVIVCLLLIGRPEFVTLFRFVAAYFCFWFAYRTHWYGFNRFGDYSYAMYLWNWPVQQTLWHFLKISEPLLMLILSFPIVLGLSVLSWRCVEKPALRLKRFGSEPRKTQVSARV